MHESFWKRRLLHKNDSIESSSSNEASRPEDGQIANGTSTTRGYRCATESANERTLMDYNGPAIMADHDGTSDREESANHIRVKRSESTDDSNVRRHRRSNRSASPVDSLPRLCVSRSDAIYANLGESSSKIETVYATTVADRKDRSGVQLDGSSIETHPRHRRGVLQADAKHRRRAKGTTRRSKHRVGTEARGKKKHGTAKSSRKPVTKKTNTSGTFLPFI